MTELRYIDCPHCGLSTEEPLLPARASYRLVHTHRLREGGPCRVVVTVHPTGRTEIDAVPAEVSLEDALCEYRLEAAVGGARAPVTSPHRGRSAVCVL